MAQDHLYSLQRVVYRVQLKSDPPFDPQSLFCQKKATVFAIHIYFT